MTVTFEKLTEEVDDLFGRLYTVPRKQRMKLAETLGDTLRQMLDRFPEESAAWLNRYEQDEQ